MLRPNAFRCRIIKAVSRSRDSRFARTGGNIVAKYQDVAEWVPSSEQIPTGTVVVLDSTNLSKSFHQLSHTTRAWLV
jgi:hypothetical protein